MKNLIYILFVVLTASACAPNNEAAQNNTKTPNDSKKIDTAVANKIDTTKAAANNDTLIDELSKDKEIFAKLIEYSNANHLADKPISEIEIEMAKQLLGIPYVAFTLENDSVEQLAINLRGLDCTTFVENVVTLARVIKSDTATFDNYKKYLTQIRYRNGEINKYPSRLHYFTDWLLDNQKKGVIEIISNKYGNEDFDPSVSFMSKNADKYKKLRQHPEFVNVIAKSEKRISAAKLKFFTPEGLKNNTDKIQNGDIIAFATTKAGLDISHVAIACFKGKELHFYHASSTKKKVVLSENSMVDYLNKIKSNNGVLVARIIK